MSTSKVQAVNRLLWKLPKGVKRDDDPRTCGKLAGVMVRRTPPKITVQDASAAKTIGKGVKDKGAWRYKDGVIERASTTRLGTSGGDQNDGVYTDHKDPGEARRKHESNFFITLNTNRRVSSDTQGNIAEEAKEACKEALKELSKTEMMCAYTKFGPKDAHYRNDNFEDVIFKADWQAAVEVGENLERLHCHIWLTYHHYSQVQINMPVMQRLFKKMYNDRAPEKLRVNGMPYIQVKLLPTSDWAMVIRQYIHKGMQSA